LISFLIKGVMIIGELMFSEGIPIFFHHGHDLEVKWMPKVRRLEKMENIEYAEKS